VNDFRSAAHDEAQRRIMETVEMPDRLAQDLIMFIRENNGTLPKRRREQEFATLSDAETKRIEAICNEVFGIAAVGPGSSRPA
jgi:hypothetical protein